MIAYKHHDINGNTYGIAIDYAKQTFYRNLNVSTRIDAKKTTRKHLRELREELLKAGFTESQEWI